MLARLRRHPFAVKAHFEHSVVLTYAVEPELLAGFVPDGLELDTYDGLGLLAIALVQVSGLRPAILPSWLGQDFFLAGYRVFVKYRDHSGRTRRGLRILRSYTNRRVMVTAGNLLTHYKYRPARVEVADDGRRLHITMATPNHEDDLELVADLAGPASLPAGSPFKDMQAARRFAGPLPYTFDYERESHAIIIIEGRRSHWNPQPIRVDVRRNTFMQRFARDRPPVLANAFHITDVDYCWLRGRIEPLGDHHERPLVHAD